MIRDLKAWRNNWEDILKLQYDCSEAFANLYKPIEPVADPEMRHQPSETPQHYLQKCLGMQKLYSDLKADLAEEISLIDKKLVFPAEEAKKNTKLLHKTIKHRDNMKLDYERYLSRAEHARKKETRSVKEEAALSVHETNLTQAQIDYQTADEQVKLTFPPVVDAVVSLMPYILANQVILQTTLVGQLYTSLDQYTRKYGLPNPAPSDAEVVRAWNQEYTGFRKELEQSLTVLAEGKAVRLNMTVAEKDTSTVTGLGIRNKVIGLKPGAKGAPPKPPSLGSRQGSIGSTQSTMLAIQHQPEPEEQAPPKPPRPGMGASPGSPGVNMDSKPRTASFQNTFHASTNAPPYDHKPSDLTPTWPNNPPPSYEQAASGTSSPPSRYHTPVNGSANPNDSFPATNQLRRTSTASSIASSAANAVAAKKKGAPPVPAKRIPSAQQQAQIVTAIFDFEGQTETDLRFREGDRIRVVKKTNSVDDWWTGELAGRTGEFPANYVRF